MLMHAVLTGTFGEVDIVEAAEVVMDDREKNFRTPGVCYLCGNSVAAAVILQWPYLSVVRLTEWWNSSEPDGWPREFWRAAERALWIGDGWRGRLVRGLMKSQAWVDVVTLPQRVVWTSLFGQSEPLVGMDAVSLPFRAVWTSVFRHLDEPGDVCRAREVCRMWRNVVDSDQVAWQQRCEERFPSAALMGREQTFYQLYVEQVWALPNSLIVEHKTDFGATTAEFVLRWVRPDALGVPPPPSDAHEILQRGGCQWCGSADAQIRGLRSMKRFTNNFGKLWTLHHKEIQCNRCRRFTQEFVCKKE
jgi:hypothetical protein